MTDSTVDFNSDDIVNDLSAVDDGQGEDFSGDTGPVQPDATQTANSPQEQQIADNPAWKPYLDKVDPSQHGPLREILADLDARTQKRFDRQAELEKNYGQFAQAKVDPKYLQAGYQLFQNLNNDPQTFYSKLGESLGISPQQAEALVDGGEEEVDPQQQQMAQQLEEVRGYLAQQKEFQEQQRYQQEVNQEEQRLNVDLEKIQSQYNLSAQDMQDVIQRTLFLTQSNPAATIWDGLQQSLNYRASWEKNRPTNSAPSVLSGNGSSAAPVQTAFVEKSDKEQRDELAKIIAEL